MRRVVTTEHTGVARGTGPPAGVASQDARFVLFGTGLPDTGAAP